jgi:hypothetical protein
LRTKSKATTMGASGIAQDGSAICHHPGGVSWRKCSPVLPQPGKQLRNKRKTVGSTLQRAPQVLPTRKRLGTPLVASVDLA